MCEHKPHYHEKSYSMSTGAVRTRMSDVSWAPLMGVYLVPSFPFYSSANSARGGWLSRCRADQPCGHRGWLAAVCCQEARLTADLCLSSWRCHHPVSDSLRRTGAELSPIFLSHCWMRENWFMCWGRGAVDWTNSTICKAALLRKLKVW